MAFKRKDVIPSDSGEVKFGAVWCARIMKQGLAKAIQTNQFHLCTANSTLEVHLTFSAIEKFHYKNLHFVLLSSFFFVSHNLFNESPQNYRKITTVLQLSQGCAFSFLDTRLATTSLATQQIQLSAPFMMPFFIPSDSLPC